MRISYAEELGECGARLVETLNSFRGQFDFTKAGVLAARQYAVVEYVIRNYVQLGSGVLVFVAGMSDINELCGIFEEDRYLNRDKFGARTFKLFAIHRDIPLEEQEEAFLPVGPDEIKIILATNAAESSITVPDTDVVIDMGIHKEMKFDESRHQTFLCSTWISKASAAQRAGRTGRLRPGKVYRMYSKHVYNMLEEHPTAEVSRIPMQDVIIRLRYDFEKGPSFRGVRPILSNMIQPPDLDNIERSFANLFDSGLITDPSDDGILTSLGRFCCGLSMDINLGMSISIRNNKWFV